MLSREATNSTRPDQQVAEQFRRPGEQRMEDVGLLRPPPPSDHPPPAWYGDGVRGSHVAFECVFAASICSG